MPVKLGDAGRDTQDVMLSLMRQFLWVGGTVVQGQLSQDSLLG